MRSLFYAAAMHPRKVESTTVFIQRHCLQQLIHQAISAAPKRCHGLLTGRGNIIESHEVVTQNFDPARLSNHSSDALGFYLCGGPDDKVDPHEAQQLHDLFVQTQGKSPAWVLLLETGQKGRVDAQLYTDTQCQTALTLELIE